MKQGRTHARDQGSNDNWIGVDQGGDDRTAFSARCKCGKYWTGSTADALRETKAADLCKCPR